MLILHSIKSVILISASVLVSTLNLSKSGLTPQTSLERILSKPPGHIIPNTYCSCPQYRNNVSKTMDVCSSRFLFLNLYCHNSFLCMGKEKGKFLVHDFSLAWTTINVHFPEALTSKCYIEVFMYQDKY